MVSKLDIKGKKIINKESKEVFLRGVNLGGWLMMEGYLLHGRNIPEKEFKMSLRRKFGSNIEERFTSKFRDTFINENDIENIKNMGLNCVRVPFHYKLIESTPYKYSEKGFRYIDRLISWCKKYSIYCILDLHAACGSQNRDWHSDSKGQALLWDNEEYRKRTVALWKVIAARYHKTSTIAGYDILNESVTKKTSLLNALYMDIISVIRSVDDKHIIFIEGNLWAQDLDILKIDDGKNLAYSIHYYNPLDYTFNFQRGLVYPGKIDNKLWDYKKIEKDLDRFVNIQDRKNVPIFVGEFGVNSRCPVCHAEFRIIKDILKLFNKLRWHWTYWTYKAVSGGIFPNGIYQYVGNPYWISREGPITGWETYYNFSSRNLLKLIGYLDTRYFTKNRKLADILRRLNQEALG